MKFIYFWCPCNLSINAVHIWRTRTDGRGTGVIEPETINHRRVMATNISRSLARSDRRIWKGGKVRKTHHCLGSLRKTRSMGHT